VCRRPAGNPPAGGGQVFSLWAVIAREKQEGIMLKSLSLKSLRRERVMLAGLLLAGVMQAGPAAWAGSCTPVKGITPYTIKLDSDEIDTAHNIAGQVLPDMHDFHLSNQYPIDCSCEGGSAALYFRSVGLLPPGYQDGNLTYFMVNPSLHIGVKLRMKDNSLIPAPFEDLSDGGSYACGSDGIYHHPANDAGNSGTLSLYVAQGFTGELKIPYTRIIEVYARWGTQGSYGTTPISRIAVFGTLIVPQTCTIGDAGVINVDLGPLRSADIRTPGALPANYTPQYISLDYICSNISRSMHLELTLLGEESAALPGVLQSSNPDIGVQITDGNMTPLPINNSRLPLPLPSGTSDRVGRQYLYVWPVNTTGHPPAPGPFSASALLEVEIQ
jgi:type 1 fimbria pilin